MTNPSIGQFLSSGAKAYAKFPNVGDTITGVIATIHPPEPQTDIDTGAPIEGKFQMRIELQTEERDPEVADDDGLRTLYVKGWMKGSITDALKAAKAENIAVGGKLTVTRTGSAPPRRPGIQGAYQYSAVYEPSGNFFANGQDTNGASQMPSTAKTGVTAGPQQAPIPAEPPAGIDAKAWEAMPHDVKQAIANAAAGVPTF